MAMKTGAYITEFPQDIIIFADRYFKKVIRNAKVKYYQKRLKYQKYGITFVPLSKCAEKDLSMTEQGFENALVQPIAIDIHNIYIENDLLFESIERLTDIQKEILINNVIFEVPLRTIAQDHHISLRMAEKHKANAIRKLKRSLSGYEK